MWVEGELGAGTQVERPEGEIHQPAVDKGGDESPAAQPRYFGFPSGTGEEARSQPDEARGDHLVGQPRSKACREEGGREHRRRTEDESKPCAEHPRAENHEDEDEGDAGHRRAEGS